MYLGSGFSAKRVLRDKNISIDLQKIFKISNPTIYSLFTFLEVLRSGLTKDCTVK